MNYKNVFSALLFAGLLLLSACSKKAPSIEEAAKRMAAFNEPALIMSLEIKELFDKGGITSKENIPMIAQMFFPDKIEYMTNPEKFGLDLSGTSYMAATTGDKANVVWSITKIKDKEKFEKMIKEEGYDKFEEIEGYNTTMEKESMIIAWNETLLITMISKEQKAKETFKKYATAINEEKAPTKAFVKFFEKKADVAIMTNFDRFGELQKNMPKEMRGSQSEMEMLNRVTNKMKGSYSMFSISFENDKIVTDINNMFTDALKKEMDFFSKNGLPKELLTQVGSNELTGFIAVNGDVKRYIDWLVQMMGEKDIFAEGQKETGLDIMRMMKSLKGNVLFSFLGMMKKEMSYPNGKGGESKLEYTQPQFSLIATVNDNYIETIADSILKDKKKGPYFIAGNEFNPQYVLFKPGIIFYTNDENLVKEPVVANPQMDADALKVLEQPMSFFFNLNKLIGSIDKSEMTQKVAGKFKTVYGGMNIDGGHAELILNNGGKNSLWTIINLTVEATADMAMSFK